MISRLERLVTGQDVFTNTEILFIIDVLEDDDIVSQVDGLFLRHREVGEGILKRILEYDPSYLNASYLLVHLLESSGRHREAEERLKSSVELYPEEALLAVKYADFLHNYGRDDEAEVILKCIEFEEINDKDLGLMGHKLSDMLVLLESSFEGGFEVN